MKRTAAGHATQSVGPGGLESKSRRYDCFSTTLLVSPTKNTS
jgi:hypothetical protein